MVGEKQDECRKMMSITAISNRALLPKFLNRLANERILHCSASTADLCRLLKRDLIKRPIPKTVKRNNVYVSGAFDLLQTQNNWALELISWENGGKRITRDRVIALICAAATVREDANSPCRPTKARAEQHIPAFSLAALVK